MESLLEALKSRVSPKVAPSRRFKETVSSRHFPASGEFFYCLCELNFELINCNPFQNNSKNVREDRNPSALGNLESSTNQIFFKSKSCGKNVNGDSYRRK